MKTTKWKLLNGLCVPVSTPDDYFKTSAKRWLSNLQNLVEAGRYLQQQNNEREQARIEYQEQH